MIDPDSQKALRASINASMAADRALLDLLRDEIRPLRNATRAIQPRSVTSLSVVATDGGNNRLIFDPFLVQIVRVVDSSNNEYCLELVTPTTSVVELAQRQLGRDGSPITALGRMMDRLGVDDLPHLSHMIRAHETGTPVSPTWVQVYRELVEWGILLSIVSTKDFGTDTLIVFDGLLRSKVFAGELFKRYREALTEAIAAQEAKGRRIYIVGLAKHSQVLSRYRLAMALENVLTSDHAAYVEIPREIEEKAYIWSEYARGDDREMPEGEVNKFVSGKMFFVKFGNRRHDPIWPVDIFAPQANEAQVILGSLLADAINGFPISHYPRSLQRAHENAALVDFDFDILQDEVLEALRRIIGSQSPSLDEFMLQDLDPASARYE